MNKTTTIMKRVFTLLLIACSTILAANAQKKAQSANANKPTHVVEQLEDIINDYGANGEQVYSVNRNPNTNLLESKVRVVNFRLQKLSSRQSSRLSPRLPPQRYRNATFPSPVRRTTSTPQRRLPS
jgi:hypothetical protein